MKWSKITTAKYQEIDKINNQNLSDIDKALSCLCVLYDRTEHELDEEDPKKVVKMMAEMQAMFNKPFKVKQVNAIGRYKINYDVSMVTFGQYIELVFFIGSNGSDAIKNCHFILASMANERIRIGKPHGHKQKADYLFDKPVTTVLGCVNKIIESFNLYNSQYTRLFGIDSEVSGNVQDEYFNKHYGWIYSATQVAQHEGIKLNEVYELPVRQAFNALLFLKAKGKYEMEQFRKSQKINHG